MAAPFILLPPSFRLHAKEDGLRTLSDAFLALLPTLIAHENAETRMSYPSLDRLSALAGISPNTASAKIKEMSVGSHAWLNIVRHPLEGGRVQHRYKMLYPRYEPGTSDPKEWIRMDIAMFHQGVWSVMSPATKRVYLILRAYASREEVAVGQWLDIEDVKGVDAEAAYLPPTFWDTRFLAERSGLAPRTVTQSKQWLYENGLVAPTDVDQEEGLLMPFDPKREAPKVLEAIARRKVRNEERGYPPASGYTTRGIRKMRRNGPASTGRKTTVKTLRNEHVADDAA